MNVTGNAVVERKGGTNMNTLLERIASGQISPINLAEKARQLEPGEWREESRVLETENPKDNLEII